MPLTTFSKPLANSLRVKLTSLMGGEPSVAARIIVRAISGFGYDLDSERFGQPQIAAPTLIRSLIAKSAADVEGHRFCNHFLVGEWGTLSMPGNCDLGDSIGMCRALVARPGSVARLVAIFRVDNPLA